MPLMKSEPNITPEQLEAQVAEARRIEEAEMRGDELPIVQDSYITTHPGQRNRSAVLTIRLSPEELKDLQAIAAHNYLKPSTMARSWLLREMEAQHQPAA